jgi:hypothetical protein
MKTKHFFLAVALTLAGFAVSPPPARAVVGYVNAPLTNGYNFLANPLNVPPDNLISNVLSSVPLGTIALSWNVTNQVFEPVGVFDRLIEGQPGVWLTLDYSDYSAAHFPPGLGFVLYVPQQWTNTFVGEVMQGALTTPVPGNNKLALLASKIPVPGELSSVLLFPSIDGGDAFTFVVASQAYSVASTYYADSSCWYDPGGGVSTNGPNINVAQCFFTRHPGPDTNWVRNFTVQKAADTQAGASPEIGSLVIRDGAVTLKVLNPLGTQYNVQFSQDRMNWTTLATNQSGKVWTGPVPDGPQGYFQLVDP